jgi:hypothetical protein
MKIFQVVGEVLKAEILMQVIEFFKILQMQITE